MEEINHRKLDWITIGLYLALAVFGWMNVFSSSVSSDTGFVFSFKEKYVMDLVWLSSALVLAGLILFVIPSSLYMTVAKPFFGFMLLLLVAVAFIGVEVNGSKSWFALGPLRLQPAEFSKISSSIMLALVMSRHDFSFRNLRDLVTVAAVLAVPMLAIMLEKETGSALVYLGFLLVLYREGMNGWVLILGLFAILLFILTLVATPLAAILVLVGAVGLTGGWYAGKLPLAGAVTAAVIILLALLPRLGSSGAVPFLEKFEPELPAALLTALAAVVLLLFGPRRRKALTRKLMFGFLLGLVMIFSVEFAFQKVLKDYQRARIEVLLGIKEDPMGVGYNVHQSLIAIGSGGLTGKGFLGGTQTRFDFVPEQSTDFIFCTVGEEWGFLGTISVLVLYLVLILRIMSSADKQKDHFARIYGWCVASCLLMHVVINVCMTIGLMPVIGIPLPLLSYGGSSLWAFTILIFIYLRLDFEKWRYR